MDLQLFYSFYLFFFKNFNLFTANDSIWFNSFFFLLTKSFDIILMIVDFFLFLNSTDLACLDGFLSPLSHPRLLPTPNKPQTTNPNKQTNNVFAVTWCMSFETHETVPTVLHVSFFRPSLSRLYLVALLRFVCIYHAACLWTLTPTRPLVPWFGCASLTVRIVIDVS